MLTQVKMADAVGKTVERVCWPEQHDCSDMLLVVFTDGTFAGVSGSSWEEVTLDDAECGLDDRGDRMKFEIAAGIYSKAEWDEHRRRVKS